MTTKTALPVQQRSPNGARGRDYILPACVALACAGAAFAGADTTFDPALTKFTDFLAGSGGKIITVLSLAGGLSVSPPGVSRSARSRCRSASASVSAPAFRSSPRS